MKTFSIVTLGCKVNQYESQQIRQLLEQFGLDQVETSDRPDLIVVNTCCVTHTASAKSRQYIRRAQKFSPEAVIVVCGCLPTVQTCLPTGNIGEINGLNKNTYIIKNHQDIAAELNRIVKGWSINSNLNRETNIAFRPELPLLTSFKGHTRAFLKVQDGCDGYCSYCIVPKTRPLIQSKPLEKVLQEAKALVEAGHREIVVTGVFLGAYGQNTVRRKNWPSSQNDKLAELLDKLAQIPNLARIRLSSLEPADVSQRLLDTFCEHNNIMPHLHLSLQSGSDAILKRMCRQYTVEEFRDKVELVKSRLDRPAITTDLIVGFPGETDADFDRTVDLARDVGFAKMHVFSFSPRKGTVAASMQDTVDNKVIKKRAKILRDLDFEMSLNFRQQFIGETATILLETCLTTVKNSNRRPCGRSDRYFMVYLETCLTSAVRKTQNIMKKNGLMRVKLVKNSENGVIGQP